MNADQKKRIAHEISNWKNACNCRAVQLTGDRMAALLQEMTDAPEPVPVAWRYEDAFGTHFTEDYSEFPNIPGVLSFTALFAVPPAPSAPDGWRLVPYTPTVQMLERAGYAVNNRPQPSKYEPSATPAIIFWTAMLNYAPEAVFINSCSKPPKLSDDRIREIWVEHGLDDEDVEGFARSIEREILRGGHE